MTDITINQEQRSATFNLPYEQFRQAFLQDRPDILVNLVNDQLFYYDPSNNDNSYLTSAGPLSQEFATGLIGIAVSTAAAAEELSDQAQPYTSQNTPTETPSFYYYPSEIAKSYNFPKKSQTNQGKGVVIGFMGSGGNQFDLLNQGDAFNRCLKAQGINTGKLGLIDSPNDTGANAFWGESAMDFSILRSIAPQADLKSAAMEPTLTRS